MSGILHYIQYIQHVRYTLANHGPHPIQECVELLLQLWIQIVHFVDRYRLTVESLTSLHVHDDVEPAEEASVQSKDYLIIHD